MIHYTLLPGAERKALKREYRIRLFIFSLFFISTAILAGTISLIPAYVQSYSQEKSALVNVENIKKNRKQSDTDRIINELKTTDENIKKINSFPKQIQYSGIIVKLIENKNNGIAINSIQFPTNTNNATSSITAVLQGRANTREALVQFKNKIEADPGVMSVELPVSDLAKSKEINYSIKVMLNISK